MFGYIVPSMKELTQEQLSRYKAWYCGLCRSLGERYGQADRLTLSNDMTFLVILLSSLYEPAETGGSGPCPVHPVGKRPWTAARFTAYAADMNLLLAYWKCADDAADEHSGLRALAARRLEKEIPAIEAKYTRQSARVRQCLEEIGALEKRDARDIDALAALTGKMLGEIFAPEDDVWAGPLCALGAALGRFVYLMDAYEDYDEDVRLGRFNPLKSVHAQPDYEAYMRDLLMMTMGDAAHAFELLPLEQDADLLRNVLYHGVWTRYDRLQAKKRKRDGTGTTEVKTDE